MEKPDELHKSPMDVRTLLAKIGFLTMANDSLILRVHELEEMCRALEKERQRPEKMEEATP